MNYVLQVITETFFETKEDLLAFADGPEVNRICGFGEEIKEAFNGKKPVVIHSQRPPGMAVEAQTRVLVHKVGDLDHLILNG